MERTVASDLEDLELKQSSLSKAYEELHSKASSVLELSLQWKEDVEKKMDLTRKSLQTGLESLSEHEKAVASREVQVEARETRFEAEFKSTEEQLVRIEKMIEDKGLYLQSLEYSIQEHRDELDVEEKVLASIRKSVCDNNEEFDSLKNSVELLRKEFSDLSQRVEQKSREEKSIQKTLRGYKDGIELKNRAFQALRSSVKSKEEELRTITNKIGKSVEELELEEELLEFLQSEAEAEKRSIVSLKNEIVGCSNELETEKKRLEFVQCEVKSNEEKLNTINNAIVQRSSELELKEKQLGFVQSEANSKEAIVVSLKSEILECSNELKAKEERLEFVLMETKLKEENYVSLKNSVDYNAREFELNEKRIEAFVKMLEAKEMSCESKIIEASLIPCRLNAFLKEVEARENKVETLRRSLNACFREVENRETSVESLRKSLEEHSLRLQTQERQLRERVSELESRSKESTEVRPALVKTEPLEEANTSVVPSATSNQTVGADDGRNMQLILNLQLQKHESVCNGAYDILRTSSDPAKLVLYAIDGFYPSPSGGEGNGFETRIVRRSCILLLEKLMEVAPPINSRVKDEARKLANDWIAKSNPSEPDYLEASGIVQLVNSYGLASEVNLNDLCRLLDLLGRHEESSQLRQAHSKADQSSAVPRNEKTAEDLRADLTTSFSNDPWSVVHVKIVKFLKTSPDPTNHVLDFVESFLSQNLQTGSLALGTKFMTRCVSLFEQLLKISPPMQPRVRDYAMKLAVEWNGKIKITSSWDIFAFLQFLHTYGLFSSYENAKILKLLEIISQHDDALREFKALSLADALPGFIMILIQKKKPVDAVLLIYAFNQTEDFSLSLRNYPNDMTDTSDPSKKKNHTEKKIKEQEKATDKETALSQIPADQLSKSFAYVQQRINAQKQNINKENPMAKKRGHSAISHRAECDTKRTKNPRKAPSSCPPGFASLDNP